MRKVRKRKTAVLCALALAFTLSSGVQAADSNITQDSASREGKFTISTRVEPTYMVTIPGVIPESLQIESGDAVTNLGSIQVEEAYLEPGYAIRVSAESKGELVDVDIPERRISYTICSEDKPFKSADYTKEGAGTDLTIHITEEAWKTAYSGSYTDLVTFTVAYVKTEVRD